LFFTTDPDYVRSVMLDVTESYALLSISKALLVAPENHFYYTSPYLTGEERTFICADNIEPEHIVCWVDHEPSALGIGFAPHARSLQDGRRGISVVE
jgi:hypothetical protein